MAGAISVKILADAREASKSIKDFSKDTEVAASKWEGLGSSLKSMALPAAATLAGVGALAGASISMAADYESSLMGMAAVYGEWSDEMEASAKSAAASIGLSAADYTRLATDLGGVLSSQGLDQSQVAALADPLITAADTLGDVFGTDIESALSAIEGAVKGKGAALKNLGVDITESAIAAKLASGDLGDLTGVTEETAKAMAIASLVTEEAADAQERLGDNSGTFNETQDRIKATWENLQTTLGEKLLPVVEKVMGWVEKAITWLADNEAVVRTLIVAIGAAAGAIVIMNAALAVQAALAAANPIGLIVLAIAALIGLIAAVIANWDQIKEVAGSVADWISEKWAAFTEWLGGVWQGVSDTIGAFWQGIQAVAGVAIEWVSDRWNGFIDLISGVGDAIRDAIGGAFDWVSDRIDWLVGGLQDVADWVAGIFGSQEITAAITTPSYHGITAGIFDAVALPRIAPRALAMETVNVNVTFTGLVSDPVAVGKQISDTLDRYTRNRRYLS